MTPEYKVGQYLEWYTDIPVQDEYRDSPVFFLKGNEWFFRLLSVRIGYAWHFRVALELKNKHTDLQSCLIKCKIGFKREGCILCKAEFIAADHHEVWTIRAEELQKKLPPDYMAGNLMCLVFFFHEITEPLEELPKKTEDDKSIQTPPYVDARFLLERTSKDFVKLLDEGTHHDVEFICGDQTLKAHKNILCCRSNVFASMFQGDTIEGQAERVEIVIEDKDAIFFPQFLRCLYTGMLLELTVDTAMQLYMASDKYGADTMKQQCAEFFIDNLSLENACEILILADRANDSDLKKGVMEYICKEKIPVLGEKWANFCIDNQKLANEVLNLFCQHLCPKTSVTAAVQNKTSQITSDTPKTSVTAVVQNKTSQITSDTNHCEQMIVS